MKKLIFCVVAIFAMLSTVSCNKELKTALGGDTKTVFNVSAADVATKTIADGANINALHWEIYLTANVESADAPLGKGVVRDTDGDKNFTLELDLVADQLYTILFWAQVSYAEDGLNDYYNVSDLRKVAINYYADDVDVDDEDRAAFFARHDFSTQDGPVDEDVDLYRPFAQINLGTDNLNTSLNNMNQGMVIITYTEITVTNVANVFNTVSGQGEVVPASEDVTATENPLTYKRNRTPYEDYKATHLSVGENSYHWLSMNYVAVCGEADVVTLTVNIGTTVGVVNHDVSNVPLKENHRTNIIGDLLIAKSKFDIVVDENFQKRDLKPGDVI